MNLCMCTAIFIYICVHLHPFSMWGHVCAKCVNMCMHWVCVFVFTCKWTICKMCICDFLWICTCLYVRVSLHVNIFAHCISVNIGMHTWECVYLDWILWKWAWGQFCRACPGPSSGEWKWVETQLTKYPPRLPLLLCLTHVNSLSKGLAPGSVYGDSFFN